MQTKDRKARNARQARKGFWRPLHSGASFALAVSGHDPAHACSGCGFLCLPRGAEAYIFS